MRGRMMFLQILDRYFWSGFLQSPSFNDCLSLASASTTSVSSSTSIIITAVSLTTHQTIKETSVTSNQVASTTAATSTTKATSTTAATSTTNATSTTATSTTSTTEPNVLPSEETETSSTVTEGNGPITPTAEASTEGQSSDQFSVTESSEITKTSIAPTDIQTDSVSTTSATSSNSLANATTLSVAPSVDTTDTETTTITFSSPLTSATAPTDNQTNSVSTTSATSSDSLASATTIPVTPSIDTADTETTTTSTFSSPTDSQTDSVSTTSTASSNSLASATTLPVAPSIDTTDTETTTTSTFSSSSTLASTLATTAADSQTDTTSSVLPSVDSTTELQTSTETTFSTSSSTTTTTVSPTTQSSTSANSYSEASSSDNTETASEASPLTSADTTPEVPADTGTSAITEDPSPAVSSSEALPTVATSAPKAPSLRKKRQAGVTSEQKTSQSTANESEDLTEYRDYIRGSGVTNHNRWCRRDNPLDCLETYGLANMDRFNFDDLLKTSNQDDLSDVREVFTPSVLEIRDMGVKPQEFITSCSYDHKTCSFRDFYQWQSDTYGNCYTFNSPNLFDEVNGTFVKRPLLRTSKSGYQNGLRLTLNLDAENYVSLLSPDMGVRVVVHTPSITPIPEEEGFSSPPGFLTSIGIQMKNINRVGQPHGNCHAKNWENFHRDYSQKSCRLLCLEKKIQEECGCANAINDLLQALNSPLPRCNPTNITQDLCRQVQKKVITDGRLCTCPPACEELIYNPLLSMNQINQKFYRLLKNKKSIYVGDDVCSGSGLSTARLHIYLESLLTEVITESPAMSFNDLLANVGGHLGLFIGLSLVTVVELAELVLDLVLWGGLASGRICKPKSSETSSPVSSIGILQDGVPPPADYKKPPFKQVNDYYDWYEELPPGGVLNFKKFGLRKTQ
ncbi:uncharacterized protein [Macrobrachium rosenbergii]|uniref:uncharacterized protein n=1 Tax=Macrobrachium rosenbergii TaxID=79674 RepID=UPI0034D65D00